MAITTRGAQQSVSRPATESKGNASHLAPDHPVPHDVAPVAPTPPPVVEPAIPKVIRMDEGRSVLRGNGMIVFAQGQVVNDPWLISAAIDNFVPFQVIKA